MFAMDLSIATPQETYQREIAFIRNQLAPTWNIYPWATEVIIDVHHGIVSTTTGEFNCKGNDEFYTTLEKLSQDRPWGSPNIKSYISLSQLSVSRYRRKYRVATVMFLYNTSVSDVEEAVINARWLFEGGDKLIIVTPLKENVKMFSMLSNETFYIANFDSNDALQISSAICGPLPPLPTLPTTTPTPKPTTAPAPDSTTTLRPQPTVAPETTTPKPTTAPAPGITTTLRPLPTFPPQLLCDTDVAVFLDASTAVSEQEYEEVIAFLKQSSMSDPADIEASKTNIELIRSWQKRLIIVGVGSKFNSSIVSATLGQSSIVANVYDDALADKIIEDVCLDADKVTAGPLPPQLPCSVSVITMLDASTAVSKEEYEKEVRFLREKLAKRWSPSPHWTQMAAGAYGGSGTVLLGDFKYESVEDYERDLKNLSNAYPLGPPSLTSEPEDLQQAGGPLLAIDLVEGKVTMVGVGPKFNATLVESASFITPIVTNAYDDALADKEVRFLREKLAKRWSPSPHWTQMAAGAYGGSGTVLLGEFKYESVEDYERDLKNLSNVYPLGPPSLTSEPEDLQQAGGPLLTIDMVEGKVTMVGVGPKFNATFVESASLITPIVTNAYDDALADKIIEDVCLDADKVTAGPPRPGLGCDVDVLFIFDFSERVPTQLFHNVSVLDIYLYEVCSTMRFASNNRHKRVA
ncbi:hypothetical protein Tcan_09949 [Toxocara canis]|uniref:Uncharacterized protein n=1 Tax=Toxocara canis TaxID=6265 RepID=A0A0B2V4D3_TOXCA|nr:hypothetical protein Tcan_09949 [Toxocara canis]